MLSDRQQTWTESFMLCLTHAPWCELPRPPSSPLDVAVHENNTTNPQYIHQHIHSFICIINSSVVHKQLWVAIYQRAPWGGKVTFRQPFTAFLHREFGYRAYVVYPVWQTEIAHCIFGTLLHLEVHSVERIYLRQRCFDVSTQNHASLLRRALT